MGQSLQDLPVIREVQTDDYDEILFELQFGHNSSSGSKAKENLKQGSECSMEKIQSKVVCPEISDSQNDIVKMTRKQQEIDSVVERTDMFQNRQLSHKVVIFIFSTCQNQR